MVRWTEADVAMIGKRGSSAKPKAPSEAEIQNAIRDYLAWHGWEVTRHHQTLGSRKGFPDLTACRDGWTIYIEVKTPKGVLSEDQKKFRDAITAHGGTYVVARSVDAIEGFCVEPVDKLRALYKGLVVGRDW